MLKICLPELEGFDQKTSEFYSFKSQTLTLEHSLLSLSKWESKWCKPFLSSEKTSEEMLDYIRCMTITQNVDPRIYFLIPYDIQKQIGDYINSPMTATWFTEDKTKRKNSKEVITSELIYYWMIASEIPFECEKWHLNRLLTLIRVCSIKNQPPKKMSTKATMSRNRSLNEARKKALGTNG